MHSYEMLDSIKDCSHYVFLCEWSTEYQFLKISVYGVVMVLEVSIFSDAWCNCLQNSSGNVSSCGLATSNLPGFRKQQAG